MKYLLWQGLLSRPPRRESRRLPVRPMSRFVVLLVGRRSEVRADRSVIWDRQLSQLDHVLKRPDTYIGSIEHITQPMWVYDEASKGLVYRCVIFLMLL